MVRFTDFSHSTSYFNDDVFERVPDKCGLLDQLSKSENLFDEDFLLFMKYELEQLNRNDEAEGEKGDEGEDPHLKMFMDAIRVDGNSFCVKGTGGSEIKFEMLVVSDDERNMLDVNLRSRNVPRRNKRGRNEHISHVSEPQLRCDNEDDPCYRSYVGNCGKNVDSFAVVSNGRDRRNSLKRRLRSDHNQNSRTSRSVMENGNVEGRVKTVKNRNSAAREDSSIEIERDCFVGGVNLRSEHLHEVSHKTKGCRDEGISLVSEPTPNFDKEDDPCYMSFLGKCEKNGDSFALVADGRRVEYEEDDNQSSSDSEIMVVDKTPDCMDWNYTPVSKSKELDVQMEEDEVQCLGSRSAPENQQFRKEVMDILKKPFSQKEYETLLMDVNLRKPIERHIDLRFGNKTISTEIGKSYLDHYDDLESQLDSFRSDNRKRLNILRGFFFYMKKISEDGIFKPWLDKSCLAIIPRAG